MTRILDGPAAAGRWILVITLALALAPMVARASPLEDAIARRASSDADLGAFYAGRQHRPLWTGDAPRSARARIVLDRLAHADTEGLRASDYVGPELGTLLEARDPADEARFELALSRALVRFANDVRSGRLDASAFNDDASLAPLRRPAAAILGEADAASDLGAWLDRQPPATPQYDRLRTALALYRAQARAGGWPRVPRPATRKLEPGARDPAVVPALRRHLLATGDLVGAETPLADPALFDPELAHALQAFQQRMGLESDGVLGPATLAALEVPIERRIEKLRLNLERRRWLPADLGARHLLVNIADFQLKLVEGERTIHVARVIVGKTFTSTPTFSRAMTHIVTDPYWNVPPSIAVKEILPELRKNPGYLAAQGMDVLDAAGRIVAAGSIDWRGVPTDPFPYRFRQRPGPKNALGELKFMFPNEFNVYLHDTPSRSLFQRSVRAFSHGCIRVEDPRTLATLLLEPQGWTRERLDAQIKGGPAEHTIMLEPPVPVHVTYLTAWVNRDGTIHFRDDIYGRDAKLAAALARAEGRPPS